MADKKISQLTELTSADSAIDVLPLVDSDLNQTQKIKLANLPLSDVEKASIGPFTSDQGFVAEIRNRNITSIVDSDYQNTNVTSIRISSIVTSIGNYAFAGCANLTSINIPDSVISIGAEAFDNSALTSITIPDSVTVIGFRAFSDCGYLINAKLPNNDHFNTIQAQLFFRCTSLTSITIPDSVGSIGSFAFALCTDLTSVTIGNGVTSISVGAFTSCTKLTSITIPDSVTSIGDSAFSSCALLESVNCLATTAPTIGSNAFDGVATSDIHVPIGANYPATYGGLTVFFDL
jgi:hypothetical protein